MPALVIQGSSASYTESGSGPAAVLLHSSASTRWQWRPLMEALKGFRRVLAPDLWGYGDSDAFPGRDPSLAKEIAIVDGLAERAGGPIDLVGHSFGGALALRFTLERPELVRSLTLIEPVAFHLLRMESAGEQWLLSEVRAVAAAVARDRNGTGMRRFVDYWNDSGTWAGLSEDKRSGLARLAARVAENFAATLAEAIPLETYRQIQVPALLFRGARSPAPTRRIVGLLGSTLPNVRVRTIPDGGHMLPQTHSDLLIREIVAHMVQAASEIEMEAA
jgi:pimeloyl-ACP methyl ester carboxylesterase